jgi:penicillin-binding protein 1A
VQEFSPQQATEVYDAKGGLLGLFSRERRQLVSLDSLPPHVPLAFVAVEDRRFFEHSGVDVKRVLGAVVDNLTDGFAASGASTITMQVARNLFPAQLPARSQAGSVIVTVRRKVAETRLALEMERQLSKERILELYLNHIFLGAGAYGIQAAARTYFDKSAADLTAEEAALLAGLAQRPSAYNPRRNPEAATNRRNTVLRAMRSTGVLDEAAMEAAIATPLALAPPAGVVRAPYFVEQIRRELEDRFGELLYTGGLRIHTTLDPDLQAEAEAAMEAQLQAVERGTYGRYSYQTYENFVQKLAEEGSESGIASTPYLQSTVVSLDPATGDVLAMVGGRDFRHSQFNRATQALRQPGSSFKPFVYAAALEQGKSPLYRVSDQPLIINLPDGRTYVPRNFSNDYDGDLTLREALKRSKNIATIRLGQEIGTAPVASLAARAGVETPVPNYPSVFIGAAAVYPLQLIAAYAAFANGGFRVAPRYIRSIEDASGRVLWEPRTERRIAFTPAVSWIMTDMLREVVDGGTGSAVRTVGGLPYSIPAAGKTGTTNDATDVWFVGYTPDVVTGVWIGMDQPQTISGGATGGGFAAPVWARVVRKYYEEHPTPEAWARPEDVAVRRISRWTGLAVTDDCPYIVGSERDYFVEEVAPEPGCEAPRIGGPQPAVIGRPLSPEIMPRLPGSAPPSVPDR